MMYKYIFIISIGMSVMSCHAKINQGNNHPLSDLQTYEGYFMYMADAAVFKVCGSEKITRVSNEMVYIDVERKYLSLVEGGTWVYFQCKGQIKNLINEEGNISPSLVIREMLIMDKNKNCIKD